MQQLVEKVGALIASTKVAALKENTLQALETWDHNDEEAAERVAEVLGDKQCPAKVDRTNDPDEFDDARILAGVTLATLSRPRDYQFINEAVAETLEVSYRRDTYLHRKK